MRAARGAGALSSRWPSPRPARCQSTKPKTSAELLLTERMAQVLLRENRPAEAEKAFREVLKDDPKNPEVQDGLGLSLLMQSRFEESLPYFDKAVDLAPQNASYRNNRGVALMELGKFKEAAADFEAAEHSRERRRPRLGDDQPGAPPAAPGQLRGRGAGVLDRPGSRPAVVRRRLRPSVGPREHRGPRGSGRGLPGGDPARTLRARRRTCGSACAS